MVKLLIVCHMMCFISSAFAMTSSATEEACAKKFVARVERVIEAPAPLGPRSINKVILKSEEILRGQVEDEEEVQVLTYSTIKFEQGESYVVELNNGKICTVEPLNEHHEH